MLYTLATVSGALTGALLHLLTHQPAEINAIVDTGIRYV